VKEFLVKWFPFSDGKALNLHRDSTPIVCVEQFRTVELWPPGVLQSPTVGVKTDLMAKL